MTAEFLRLDEQVGTSLQLFQPASDWAGKAVPEREWHVEGLIPSRQVTLLSGDGGVGKSLLALQAAIATATNSQWMGREIANHGTALYFTAEDGMDELHRRVAAVCDHLQICMSRLSDLWVESRAGSNAVLGALNKQTNAITETELLKQIDDALTRLQPKLLVLDTLADIFGGNEIDRVHARQFIGLLRGLAINHDTSVLVLSHPSLSGISSGSGLSGSTGWNASVRSRLYMERVVEQGEEIDSDVRRLSTKKANYARAGDEIALRWKNGCFVTEGGSSQLDRMAKAAHAERVFLNLLDEFNNEGRRVRHTTGDGFAPNAFHKSGRSEGVSKKALRIAMESLFARGAIEAAKEGPPSRATSFIRRAQK